MTRWLSPVLTDVAPDRVAFWCPGCNEAHQLTVSGPGAVWGYNNNPAAPTFTPSVLMRSGHFVTGQEGKMCWCTYRDRLGKPAPFECKLCHSFVTDGRIQFLSDCSHALAGQTVDLPDYPA